MRKKGILKELILGYISIQSIHIVLGLMRFIIQKWYQ